MAKGLDLVRVDAGVVGEALGPLGHSDRALLLVATGTLPVLLAQILQEIGEAA